jgi:hypothetical protein
MFLVQPVRAAPCLLCGQTDVPSASGNAAEDDVPLRIEISAQLDFSRIATGRGGGSITIDPASGARRLSGDVRDLGGMALSGEAVITGTPGRGVRIFLPATIDLDGDHGRRARVVDLATNLGPAPRIGPDGSLRFRFGGRLAVASDDDGNYRGRVPISAEYE